MRLRGISRWRPPRRRSLPRSQRRLLESLTTLWLRHRRCDRYYLCIRIPSAALPTNRSLDILENRQGASGTPRRGGEATPVFLHNGPTETRSTTAIGNASAGMQINSRLSHCSGFIWFSYSIRRYACTGDEFCRSRSEPTRYQENSSATSLGLVIEKSLDRTEPISRRASRKIITRAKRGRDAEGAGLAASCSSQGRALARVCAGSRARRKKWVHQVSNSHY